MTRLGVGIKVVTYRVCVIVFVPCHGTGSEQHTARLKKVVEKFVSKYPTELENAGTASKPQLSAAEATEAADKFKAEGNEKLKAKDFRAAVASYTKV